MSSKVRNISAVRKRASAESEREPWKSSKNQNSFNESSYRISLHNAQIMEEEPL